MPSEISIEAKDDSTLMITVKNLMRANKNPFYEVEWSLWDSSRATDARTDSKRVERANEKALLFKCSKTIEL